jgi:POT family proton-dependent oligopeptide transporter
VSNFSLLKGRAAGGNDLLGHPRGLTFLFATEMWERFSYYGMRALLVLYLVHYLFQPGHMDNVVGLATVKRALEAMSGPLDAQPLASQIYGFYTGLVYLAPVFGGLLADRVLGQRRTVIIGATLMAVGHFMMAFEHLLLLALLALILGNGAFKPNISTQVGGLYAPATIAAIAPIRSFTSVSISGLSSLPSSAARSGRRRAGTMDSPQPVSAW